jgi:hypothetical protein
MLRFERADDVPIQRLDQIRDTRRDAVKAYAELVRQRQRIVAKLGCMAVQDEVNVAKILVPGRFRRNRSRSSIAGIVIQPVGL